MHLTALICAIVLLAPAALAADDSSSAVILLKDGGLNKLAGQATDGASQSFSYTVLKRREVTIRIEADNDSCGADLRRDTERGFMPKFENFPATRVESFNDGETLKVSFFQTRLAVLRDAPCQFSLTIK